MRDIEIYQEGTAFRLSSFGFRVEEIKVNSAEQENNYERLDGVSGRYRTSSTLPQTAIEVIVEFDTDSDFIYSLKRDELISLTTSLTPFYIREMRSQRYSIAPELPGATTGEYQAPEALYANGLQFRVLRTGAISFEDTPNGWRASVTFETDKLPYAESIGTSLDLHNTGLTESAGIWSYGMNLLEDPASWVYKFSNLTTFSFYYAGDVKVHDYKMYRELAFTMKQSASSLKVYDASGNYFMLNRTLYSGDVVKIQAFKVLVNGIDATTQSNKYFFNIYHGYNTFKVEGASIFDVAVDLRFYYGAKDLTAVKVPTRAESLGTGTTGGTTTTPTTPPPTVEQPPTNTKDTTPPSAPTVENVYVGSTGITGHSEEGATVTVTFPGGAIASSTAGLNGFYGVSKPPTVTLTAGSTITVKATDTSGNTSAVTTVTVRAYPYNAPVLSNLTATSDSFTVTGAQIGQYLWYGLYTSGYSARKSETVQVTSTPFTVDLSRYDVQTGEIVIAQYEDGQGNELSEHSSITATAGSAATTVLNEWRSSNKNLTTTLNKDSGTQVTEVLKVIGNASQNVNITTSGDSITVTGGAGEMRYYVLTGLTPNTRYTLSYNGTWTDTTQGLHTHLWGLGYKTDSEKGKRFSFSFTTNSSGQYGFGQGATDTAPASYYLNAMHGAVSNNVVTYSKITLNKGSADLGYSAGTPTGV